MPSEFSKQRLTITNYIIHRKRYNFTLQLFVFVQCMHSFWREYGALFFHVDRQFTSVADPEPVFLGHQDPFWVTRIRIQ